MKEAFNSVVETVKDRFTNPFLGTFIFVILIRNWPLLYGLFVFDKDCTMDDKLLYINDYLSNKSFWEELKFNVLYSFILIISVYIFLLLFQSILKIYQLTLKSINSFFDKIPTSSLNHYKILKKEFFNLTERYEKLNLDYENALLTKEGAKTRFLEEKTTKEQLKISLIFVIEDYLSHFPFEKISNYPVDDLAIRFNHVFRENFEKHISKEDVVLILTSFLMNKFAENRNLSIPFFRILLFYQLKHSYLDNSDTSTIKLKFQEIASQEKTSENEEFTNIFMRLTGMLVKVDNEEFLSDLGEVVLNKLFRNHSNSWSLKE